MKKLGATHLVSVSAVGSMKEEIAPGDLVVVDQFIDLTKRRATHVLRGRRRGHVAFADPVCPMLAEALGDARREQAGARVHRGGHLRLHRRPAVLDAAPRAASTASGASSVIGMTTMPEAKLAREAELPYATLALATDYDCWHESEDDVTVEAVARAR